MALTDKQVKFIDEYMIDMNATAAYLRAGYKCTEAAARSSSSDFLSNPNISEEIARRQEAMQEKTGISVQWVLDNFKSVAERCMVAEPVMEFNRESKAMEPTGEYKFDSSGANKALESIGKHLGMFTDKLKVDLNGQVNHEHEYHIEQKITADHETVELLKQLYKRQASSAF